MHDILICCPFLLLLLIHTYSAYVFTPHHFSGTAFAGPVSKLSDQVGTAITLGPDTIGKNVQTDIHYNILFEPSLLGWLCALWALDQGSTARSMLSCCARGSRGSAGEIPTPPGLPRSSAGIQRASALQMEEQWHL